MRGVCPALKMGLFLHVVGSVTPTESTADGSLLRCEGLNNQTYVCETGHCCGESQCCSYYYELWWFWLVWAFIFILSCCCVCHHRRTKHRLQQQQRQHEINLIAYREAHNYTSLPFYFRFLPNYLLPDYEEVVNRPPTPPPPYSALHTGPSSVVSSPATTDQQDGHCPVNQTTPVPPVADTLCCRPSLEEPHTPAIGYRHKPPQTATEGDAMLLSNVLQDGLTMEGLTSQEKTGGGGGDCCKDPPLLKELMGPGGCTEDKERLLSGRRRRFTGDSGIEVCVCGVHGNNGCGSGGEVSHEDKELESLLRRDGEEEEEEDDDEEASEFCDSCGQRAPVGGDEEQAPGAVERRVAARGPSRAPQPAQHASNVSLHTPVCLLLHTISEQEGPHHNSSTEPQG